MMSVMQTVSLKSVPVGTEAVLFPSGHHYCLVAHFIRRLSEWYNTAREAPSLTLGRSVPGPADVAGAEDAGTVVSVVARSP